MKKTLLLLIVAAVLSPIAAWGQGAPYSSSIQNSQGQPIAGATITVCTSAGTGAPCTPTVSIFSDAGLTVPVTTLKTDGYGYFQFYVSPGTYCYTATSPQITSTTCYPFALPIMAASTAPLTGVKFTETTAPPCVLAFDFLWGDSTAHRLKQCDNNGSPVQIVNAGVDINTLDQVTALHLASPVPVLQGGTGVTVAQGTGPKNQLAAGTTTTSDFLSYDANGNAIDSTKAVPSGAVVGTTDTQNLTGKNLTGATTGNNVSILNAQGAVGAITGTSADAVIYTYTLPANTIDTNTKSLSVRCAATHTSGTANTTLKVNVNGVTIASLASGTTASQSTSMDVEILRTASTTGGSSGIVAAATGTSGAFSIAATGLAWTSGQAVTCTFNVAATDTWSGVMFVVKQNQ